MSFAHTRRHTVEWGDCDPAGIVFYPRYFAMFDWSTAELFAAAFGMTKRLWTAKFGIAGIPMVDTRARFHVPSTFGDVVDIESRVSRFGRSSFDVEHRMLKAGVLAVECWETRVWSVRHPDDPARIKAAPIPAEVVETLGA